MIATARFLKILIASFALAFAAGIATPTLADAGLGCSSDIDCDDGNGCTLDRCIGGNCSIATCDQLAPVPACLMFVCDSPSPGPSSSCIPVPDESDNGASCNDGDRCTIGDECASGVCQGNEVNCSGLDDQCNVGRCNPSDGLCDAFPANESESCNDGDLCTTGETCNQGNCEGGSPPNCSHLDSQCASGACDPSDGQCVAEPANQGGACDDGDNCNEGETCVDGTCEGGSPVDCTHLDEECVEGQCQSDGSCAGIPIDTPRCNNACDTPADCNDGDGCTVDQCIGGECVFAGCDELMPVPSCRMFVCDSDQLSPDRMCIPVADDSKNGDDCDDDDPCTIDDECSAGECGGTTKTCDELDTDCIEGVCDDTTGACLPRPANQGGSCDDGDRCTSGEVCTDGECGGGVAPDCSGHDDDCNVGSCNPATGSCQAETANEGESCDDGDACTTGEVCSSGSCGGSTPVDCGHLDEECVTGVCQSNGDCLGIPIDTPECNNACDSDADCEDENGCTLDRCIGGQCAFASCDELRPQPPCELFVCTSGDPGADDECVPEPDPSQNGDDCDDLDACTEDDVCSDGSCAGSDKDCSHYDGDCSSGRCEPTTGACMKEIANDGDDCSDEDACTEDEICRNGACIGIPTDCSFLNSECAVGFCDERSGDCSPRPINEGGECDAGDECPLMGQCVSGECRCNEHNCDDGDPCTVDLCNPDGSCDNFGMIRDFCLDPRQSMLQLRDSNQDHQDRVRFRWKSGDPFNKPVLGNPRQDTQYALCVFETYGGIPDLAMSLVVDPSRRWRMHENRWRYRDPDMLQDGTQRIDLEPQMGHDGKLRFLARGGNTPLPGPVGGRHYFNQDETIIVQLVHTDGHCWSSTFGHRNTKKNRRGGYIGVIGGNSDSDSDSDSDNNNRKPR